MVGHTSKAERPAQHTALLLFLAIIFIAGCAQPKRQRPRIETPAGEQQTAVTVEAPPQPAATATDTPALAAAPTEPVPTAPTESPLPTPVLAPELPTPIPTVEAMPQLAPEPAVVSPTVEIEPVQPLLAGLSLEEKIGQMFMIGMPGTELDAQTRQRIAGEGLGGVIFLEKNGAGPGQVRALTSAIQNAALTEGKGIPLFIAWNHEGGRVVRRGAGMTRFPSNMAVGATDQISYPYDIGRAVGQEMASLGVNMNYAPVLDVNTQPANPVIGLRSFGDDVQLVSTFGEKSFQGLQDAGVIAVAKHFPGHGGADLDSHVKLPLLEQSQEMLWQTELAPFQAAIKAGIGAIMTAHIQVPSVDPEGRPATLSPPIVQGLLRDQLDFDGVVMTDDLGMGALGGYSAEERAIQAVLAGNDLLVTVSSSNYELYRAALLAAVQSGRLSEARIDESVRRILRLKAANDLVGDANGPLLPDEESHWRLMIDAGVDAVDLTRDRENWLPLNLPNKRLLLVTPNKLNRGSTAGDGVSLLGEYLLGRGLEVTELIYTTDDPASVTQVTQTAVSMMDTMDAAVVVTWDAVLRRAHYGDATQETLVSALLATGKPVVMAAGSLPYDGDLLPAAPALIKMYGDTPGQVAGLVSYLTGWE